MNDYTERVQRGINLLNQHSPYWLNRLDLENLYMDQEHQCILGQLFGSYAKGKNKLGLVVGCEHGFVIRFEEDFENFVDLEDALLEAISKELEKRA